MALTALDEYDLPITRVRLLTHHFNAIFRLDASDGSKYVLRINIPGMRRPGEIRSEALWLDALRRDTSLGVPRPLANRQGELVTTVSTPGVPEPRHCVIFDWVPGRDLRHAISPQHYGLLGAFTARLHTHAAGWTPSSALDLKTHTGIFLFESRPFFWEAGEEFMPPGRAAVVREAVGRIEAMLDELYRTSGPPVILHADLHQNNLRLHRGVMHALDFDDCLLGHFVQDVGITFYYIQDHPEFDALFAAYRRGYEAHRPWPETRPGQISGMLAARELLLAQFLFTSDNPRYRGVLPQFLARTEKRLRTYLERTSG